MIWGRGDGAVEDFIEEWEERRYQEPPEETTMMKQEITYENPPPRYQIEDFIEYLATKYPACSKMDT
jgi:hypothetical protein